MLDWREFAWIEKKEVRTIKKWKNATAITERWDGLAIYFQKILEQNILKLNYKSFHQVVVLGSSSFIPFMQLPAWSRRGVIEDLLELNCHYLEGVSSLSFIQDWEKRKSTKKAFSNLFKASSYAKKINLEVHAGHGLTYKSAKFISKIKIWVWRN